MAGPLVAGAVLLDKPIRGLRDSKKLTRQQRETLAIKVASKAQALGLGWVSPQELDEVGLTHAVRLAMERALAMIAVPYLKVIIDGNYNFLATNPLCETLVKADDLIPSVSAASIVAKVARDHYMRDSASRHPGYGFETHVGYCTPEHIRALEVKGACELHRRSFRPVQECLAAK